MKMICEIIARINKEDFADDLENFVKDYDSYSVQYKPVAIEDDHIMYTALVMIPVEDPEDEQKHSCYIGVE